MVHEFIRASSLEEAVKLKEKGFIILAGGTQINRAPYKNREKAQKFVSLENLNLNNITKRGGTLQIGASVTLQNLIDNETVPQVIQKAARFVPARNIRNMATIGGNIGANLPDSCLIPLLCALDALLITARGESLGIVSYIEENRTDFITSVSIPPSRGSCRVIRESRSSLSLPLVSAAVYAAAGKQGVDEVRIFAGCINQRVIRLPLAETYLKGLTSFHDREIKVLEEKIDNSLSPEPDIRGSRDYLKYINRVLIGEAARETVREVLS